MSRTGRTNGAFGETTITYLITNSASLLMTTSIDTVNGISSTLAATSTNEDSSGSTNSASGEYELSIFFDVITTDNTAVLIVTTNTLSTISTAVLLVTTDTLSTIGIDSTVTTVTLSTIGIDNTVTTVTLSTIGIDSTVTTVTLSTIGIDSTAVLPLTTRILSSNQMESTTILSPTTNIYSTSADSAVVDKPSIVPSEGSSSISFNTGAIVGVTVGVIILIIIIMTGMVVCIVVRKKRNKRKYKISWALRPGNH